MAALVDNLAADVVQLLDPLPMDPPLGLSGGDLGSTCVDLDIRSGLLRPGNCNAAKLVEYFTESFSQFVGASVAVKYLLERRSHQNGLRVLLHKLIIGICELHEG